MEKLKCKVVMLPTPEKEVGAILSQKRLDDSVVLYTGPHSTRNTAVLKNYHLYFISNREIKEGDFGLHCLPEKETNYTIVKCTKGNAVSIQEWWRNIEATTNPSLGLPIIPQSFVEKYVAEQGKIKEVMIEMDNLDIVDFVKTRKDGTVIVHKVKDSWTREEVSNLIKTAVMACQVSSKLSIRPFRITCDEWIEQNL